MAGIRKARAARGSGGAGEGALFCKCGLDIVPGVGEDAGLDEGQGSGGVFAGFQRGFKRGGVLNVVDRAGAVVSVEGGCAAGGELQPEDGLRDPVARLRIHDVEGQS